MPTNPLAGRGADPRTQILSLVVTQKLIDSLHLSLLVLLPIELHELQKQPNDRQTGMPADSASSLRSNQPITYAKKHGLNHNDLYYNLLFDPRVYLVQTHNQPTQDAV